METETVIYGKREGGEKDGARRILDGNEAVSTPFFIMPAASLQTLRDELTPLTSELAVRAILFRYGFRSGEACMHSMGIKAINSQELPDILPDLWDEIGLGRLTVKRGGKTTFSLELSESIEGKVIGDVGQASCDFTRGYLAGLISYLSGRRYHCKEKKCISRGDGYCSFVLTVKSRGGET